MPPRLVRPRYLPEHDGTVDPAVAQLAPCFRDWLEPAAPFITGAKRAAFLALTRDYQRDAFIDRFWRERPTYPQTPRNELRERFEERVRPRAAWGDIDDPSRASLPIHGPPDHAIQVKCTTTPPGLDLDLLREPTLVDFPFLLVFVKSRWNLRRGFSTPAQGCPRWGCSTAPRSASTASPARPRAGLHRPKKPLRCGARPRAVQAATAQRGVAGELHRLLLRSNRRRRDLCPLNSPSPSPAVTQRHRRAGDADRAQLGGAR